MYKSSVARSDIHNSGTSFSSLPTALSLLPCPTAAPWGTALPGRWEDTTLSQWPQSPRLLLRMPTAWVASVCPVPSKLAPGSWTTVVRRPTVSLLSASQRVTSKLLAALALERWPVSPIPAQLPAAGHSPLSPAAVGPWPAPRLHANQREELPLSVSQPAVSPGHTSGPVCPAAEEIAKCRSQWGNQDSTTCQLCLQDLPACCLSLNSSSLLTPILTAWLLATSPK